MKVSGKQTVVLCSYKTGSVAIVSKPVRVQPARGSDSGSSFWCILYTIQYVEFIIFSHFFPPRLVKYCKGKADFKRCFLRLKYFISFCYPFGWSWIQSRSLKAEEFFKFCLSALAPLKKADLDRLRNTCCIRPKQKVWHQMQPVKGSTTMQE